MPYMSLQGKIDHERSMLRLNAKQIETHLRDIEKLKKQPLNLYVLADVQWHCDEIEKLQDDSAMRRTLVEQLRSNLGAKQ